MMDSIEVLINNYIEIDNFNLANKNSDFDAVL